MKKCLIVVDYQNDFVTGSLGFEKAEQLDGRIADKIEDYRTNGWKIVFTFDTHEENYLQTNEGRNLPVEHCIKGTDGHKLYGRTAEMRKESDKCFFKPSFGSAELFEYLKGEKFDKVELCGVVTNICVISNAVLAKTALPKAEVSVDSACVASNDDNLNKSALDVMKSLQINVF
ncbi:MAG: cysteine hydrolase family protein [Ruminococcus sp.]